jgi:hypothetical protein
MSKLTALTEALQGNGREARQAIEELCAQLPADAPGAIEGALSRWLEQSGGSDMAASSAARSTLETAVWSLGRTRTAAALDVLRRLEPRLAAGLTRTPALRPILERLREGLGTPTSSAELLASLVSDPHATRRGVALTELVGREETFEVWPPRVLETLLALAGDDSECEDEHMQPNHLACQAVTLLARGPRTPAVEAALRAAADDDLTCLREAGRKAGG